MFPFGDLQLKQLRIPATASKTFTCSQCSGSITLRAYPYLAELCMPVLLFGLYTRRKDGIFQVQQVQTRQGDPDPPGCKRHH